MRSSAPLLCSSSCPRALRLWAMRRRNPCARAHLGDSNRLFVCVWQCVHVCRDCARAGHARRYLYTECGGLRCSSAVPSGGTRSNAALRGCRSLVCDLSATGLRAWGRGHHSESKRARIECELAHAMRTLIVFGRTINHMLRIECPSASVSTNWAAIVSNRFVFFVVRVSVVCN